MPTVKRNRSYGFVHYREPVIPPIVLTLTVVGPTGNLDTSNVANPLREIELSWNAIEGADYYRLTEQIDGGDPATTTAFGTVTFDFLAPGNYTAYIEAYDAEDNLLATSVDDTQAFTVDEIGVPFSFIASDTIPNRIGFYTNGGGLVPDGWTSMGTDLTGTITLNGQVVRVAFVEVFDAFGIKNFSIRFWTTTPFNGSPPAIPTFSSLRFIDKNGVSRGFLRSANNGISNFTSSDSGVTTNFRNQEISWTLAAIPATSYFESGGQYTLRFIE